MARAPRNRGRATRVVRTEQPDDVGRMFNEETEQCLKDLGLDTHFPSNYSEPNSVGEKARMITARLSKGAAEQYLLSMTLRLQMRGATNVQIAQTLNVSTATVSRYRAKLATQLESEMRTRSPELLLGQLVASFKDLVGTAMSEYQNTRATRTVTRTNMDGSIDRFEEPEMRNLAYRSAMFGHAITGMTRISTLLTAAGVFDNLKVARGNPTSDEESAARMKRLMADAIDPEVSVGDMNVSFEEEDKGEEDAKPELNIL